MLLFIANIFGWIMSHLRLIGIFALIIILAIGVGWIYKACGRRSARLTQEQSVKAQQAIAKQDRAEMEKVLVESDIDEAVADKGVIDAEIQKEATIAEAKKKAQAMSNDELATELERRAKQ